MFGKISSKRIEHFLAIYVDAWKEIAACSEPVPCKLNLYLAVSNCAITCAAYVCSGCDNFFPEFQISCMKLMTCDSQFNRIMVG
jgi:hypothetical protein